MMMVPGSNKHERWVAVFFQLYSIQLYDQRRTRVNALVSHSTATTTTTLYLALEIVTLYAISFMYLIY